MYSAIIWRTRVRSMCCSDRMKDWSHVTHSHLRQFLLNPIQYTCQFSLVRPRHRSSMGLKHAYLSHAIFPFQLAGRSAPVPYFPSQLFPSNFPSHLPLPASSLSPILILSFQILSTLPKRLLRRVYGILSVSSKFS